MTVMAWREDKTISSKIQGYGTKAVAKPDTNALLKMSRARGNKASTLFFEIEYVKYYVIKVLNSIQEDLFQHILHNVLFHIHLVMLLFT